MASCTRQKLEEWLKTIEVKAGRVLDIGGSQLLINKRVKSWEVDEALVLDLEIPHEEKFKSDIVCDLNYGLNSLSYNDTEKVGDRFDVAFCIEVSEYWFDPMKALNTINTLLKKGGILYISFHFIYPVHNPVCQDYLRYTPVGCEKLLEESGFKIEELEPRKMSDYPKWFLFQNSEKMRPGKDYDMHDWAGVLIKAIKL